MTELLELLGMTCEEVKSEFGGHPVVVSRNFKWHTANQEYAQHTLGSSLLSIDPLNWYVTDSATKDLHLVVADGIAVEHGSLTLEDFTEDYHAGCRVTQEQIDQYNE